MYLNHLHEKWVNLFICSRVKQMLCGCSTAYRLRHYADYAL